MTRESLALPGTNIQIPACGGRQLVGQAIRAVAVRFHRVAAGLAVVILILYGSLTAEAARARVLDGFLRTRPNAPVQSTAILLRAFASVVQETKDSVVRLDVDEKEAALATVIDTNGLVLT